MNPIEAAIYARVSSERQANAQTIESQLAALRQRVVDDGVPLPADREFVDDGYSGATLVRPALERLRDLATANGIDRIYVHSPDRLARNYAYQVLLLDEWRRCGVEVVFLNRPLGQSPEDDLLLQVQGMVAEYERAKIMERCRRGKRHAALKGSLSAMSCAPYGYRYVSAHDGGGQARFEPVPEQARVVRQIFDWMGRERCSLHQIARRLEEAGELTQTGKRFWSRTIVWHILQNPAYKGQAVFGKTRAVPRKSDRLRPPRGRPIHSRRDRSYTVTDRQDWISIPTPALIDDQLFEAAQEQLRENRSRARQGRRRPGYLLQGLICCPVCSYAYYGKTIRQRGAGKKRMDFTYYRCSGTDSYRFSDGAVCMNRQVRGDLLEAAVWCEVCALLENPHRLEQEFQRRLQGTRPDEDIALLQTQISKLNQTIGRLIDGYGEGLIEKEEFTPRIQRAKARMAKLETQIQKQSEVAARRKELLLLISRLEDFAARVKRGLQETDWTSKREIIRTVVKRVEVGPTSVNVVFRVDPSVSFQPPGGRLLPDCTWRL